MKKVISVVLCFLGLVMFCIFMDEADSEQHPSTVTDNEWLGVQAFKDTVDSDGLFIAKDPWVDVRAYSDLQAAVDACSEGGTIVIPDTITIANGDSVVITGNKGITLLGMSVMKSTIHNTSTDSTPSIIIGDGVTQTSQINIINLGFRGSTTGGEAIRIYGATDNLIRDSYFRYNLGSIVIDGGDGAPGNRIENCLFSSDYGDEDGDAVIYAFDQPNNLQIRDCRLSNNQDASYSIRIKGAAGVAVVGSVIESCPYGIWIGATSRCPTIRDCHFENMSGGYDIQLITCTAAVVEGCYFYGDSTAILLSESDEASITGNKSSNRNGHPFLEVATSTTKTVSLMRNVVGTPVSEWSSGGGTLFEVQGTSTSLKTIAATTPTDSVWFEAGKIHASGTRWRSRAIDINVPKLPVADPAALTIYQEFQVMDFAEDADDNAYLIWHVPCQYADGDSVALHFDVMLPGACTIDSVVGFAAEYKFLDPGDTFDFSTGTATVLDSLTFNSTGAYEVQQLCLHFVTTAWTRRNTVLMRLYRDVDAVHHNYGDVARIFDMHMDYKGPGVLD